MAVPRIFMASSSARMVLNPSWFLSIISPQQKALDSRDRVEDRGPFLMAWWMVARDYSGPTSTEKPLDV